MKKQPRGRIFATIAVLSLSLPTLMPAQDTIVSPSRGGALTNPPMVHADITVDADARQLQVVVATNDRPKLRPLPDGYAFDQDSKYRVMQGKAYNYQYAWNPGGIISPPAGAAIWIECLETTPGLETYDGPGNKNENPPRPYTPIFGTAGSPRIWKWYGRMAHNTYALRNPITNVITASYRLFIGDAQTGSREAYTTYADAIVTLTWDIDPPVFVTPYLAGGQVEGDMIHIDVSYDDVAGKVLAQLDSSQPTPELRPLKAGFAFDPVEKYAALNQRAHNAQYGFNISGYFAIPPGSAFWVQQVAASPGLEVYQGYSSGGAYSPILGTEGTSLLWKWSGIMTHNTYAVLNPSRERYVADLFIYLGDAQTGSRASYAHIEGATVRLAWNTVPSSFPPPFHITGFSHDPTCVTAEFPGEFGRSFTLESNISPDATNQWTVVAGPMPGSNAVQRLTCPKPVNASGFYRLRSDSM